MPVFNFRTKLYEGNEHKYETHSDATKIKWKCESAPRHFGAINCCTSIKLRFISY